MSDEQGVSLRPFGAGLPAPSDDLAALHRTLLPTSPVLLLGKSFLPRFYYAVLPEDDLVFGTVAYHQGRAVAFAVATRDSNGLLSTAIKRRWRTLCSVTLRHPPSPKGVWQAARLATSRGRDAEQGLGEILSLGVLTPDQGGPTSTKVRRTLARQLLDDVLVRLGDEPVIALVDETNASARLMYGALGWTVTAKATAGWPTPQLVYRSPDRVAETSA